ncbi:hypothetical protein NQ318_007372, partial [Aromia moschata]
MHPDNVQNFFRTLIKDAIDHRQKNNIVRPDYIQHLLDVRTGTLQSEEPTELTCDDITAQALDFFYGGFYSTTNLMVFCIYELAVNPLVQQRLRREIDETFMENDGMINYNTLIRMKYFDTVISETLRKWPTTWLDRKSRKPIVIAPEKDGEKNIELESGSICWIPAFAIHRDPKYWPDPEKFNPERFSEENRSKIKSHTFLSFGAGGRNCI